MTREFGKHLVLGKVLHGRQECLPHWRFSRALSPFLACALLLCLLTGCQENTAFSHGKSTALDSVNLVEMTDDMTRKLLGNAAVQSEMAAKGRLKVVIQPVENRMTAEVLPRGAKDAFIARLRNKLQEAAPEKFAWVVNRDAWHAVRALELDAGPDPDRVQPEYSLTARFSSITKESSKSRSLYYLCTYTLNDINGGTLLWTGSYEVKKSAVKGFLD